MKKFLSISRLPIALVLISWLGSALAAGATGYPHDKAPVNLDNKGSLQRGARLFVNYCMACHSLKFQRYNRLARDLELDEQQVLDNLVFTADTKIGDTMDNTMATEQAKNWFGAEPPDLSLIARSRGADYLYNYLRAFYLDPQQPLGANNAVRTVSMPHVLWELQGWQKPVYGAGDEAKTIVGFELVQAGSMMPLEFDRAMADLVNFLVYVGEPIQQERKALGFWVLLYLLLALVIFYLLKREYWKDVH